MLGACRYWLMDQMQVYILSYFENITLSKSSTIFGQLLYNFGLLFISTSGHAANTYIFLLFIHHLLLPSFALLPPFIFLSFNLFNRKKPFSVAGVRTHDHRQDRTKVCDACSGVIRIHGHMQSTHIIEIAVYTQREHALQSQFIKSTQFLFTVGLTSAE